MLSTGAKRRVFNATSWSTSGMSAVVYELADGYSQWKVLLKLFWVTGPVSAQKGHEATKSAFEVISGYRTGLDSIAG